MQILTETGHVPIFTLHVSLVEIIRNNQNIVCKCPFFCLFSFLVDRFLKHPLPVTRAHIHTATPTETRYQNRGETIYQSHPMIPTPRLCGMKQYFSGSYARFRAEIQQQTHNLGPAALRPKTPQKKTILCSLPSDIWLSP